MRRIHVYRDSQLLDNHSQLAESDPHEIDQGADETQEPFVVFFVTPEQPRPYPRVPPTTTKVRGVEQIGRTRTLTETTEKEKLGRMVESRKKPQKEVAATLPKKAKDFEDIEDELQECLFMDDVSDESLCLGEIEPDTLFNVNILTADDFVLVIFIVGKGNIFNVARAAKTGDDHMEIMFLKKMGQISFFFIPLTRLQFQNMILS
ncbi:hypothetical protein QYM36_000493 [Artemia franciscana]|uniref:Uncharacterized protein n=1 Tax=Artemia franciscana TaxID=6661 RepID=A0AA88ICZ4_ARTSF|nr:hypothetical protein QYM36_000493 [Artemia franciscana]